MTEHDIQKLLYKEYIINRQHKLSLDNVYLYEWESDFLSITKSDLIWEFEIKCSRQDYKNDFKKTLKHNRFTRLVNIHNLPSRFYYVCPDELINVDDIPEYAGLIYVQQYGMNKFLKEIKKAPILHNEKFDRWEETAIKLFYKLN